MITASRKAYSSHNVEMEWFRRLWTTQPPPGISILGEKTSLPAASLSKYSDPSVCKLCGGVIDDVTVAVRSRAYCSCTVGQSDMEVGVKLTSDVGNFHGEGTWGDICNV